jgi:hypothetical protein
VIPSSPAYQSRRQRLKSPSAISRSSIVSCPPAPSVPILRTPHDCKFEYLPQNLSWLKNICLQLWIDQEGFRAIRPEFKLAGYSDLDRSFEPFGRDPIVIPQASSTSAGLDQGIADFQPVERQVFFFHRSTLDSAPVFRRLTVNGDEARDYISRQASLVLKNGVYTVRGNETSALSNDRNTNSDSSVHAKLKWKFDYMVQDRKGDKTGKILAGEKTFTPLAFSCTPSMLHSLQGKKVRLMHIVKKSVATKIPAEKVEPPNPPTKSPVLPFALKTNVISANGTAYPVELA